MHQEFEASFSYSNFKANQLTPYLKNKAATKHSLIKKTSRKILKPNEEKTYH